MALSDILSAARSKKVHKLQGSGPDPMRAWVRVGVPDDVSDFAALSQQVRRDAHSFVPDLRFYDVILLNTSAGKDSIASALYLAELAHEAGVYDRLIMVHADLGEAEWDGTKQLAQRHAGKLGVPFRVVAKPVSLMERIEAYGLMPDLSSRYCTGEFKTAQVDQMITGLVEHLTGTKAGSLITSQAASLGLRPVRVLNMLGMRAAEGGPRGRRAKMSPFVRRVDNTRRLVDVWLPIHGWSDDRVWASVRSGPLEPPGSYACGMTRHSCKFCIMASQPDLVNAALLAPESAERYRELEARLSDPRVNPWDGDVLADDGGPIEVVTRIRPGHGNPHQVQYRYAGSQRTVTLPQWKRMVSSARVVSLGKKHRGLRKFPVMPMSELVPMAEELRAMGVDPRRDPVEARRQIERRLFERRQEKKR